MSDDPLWPRASQWLAAGGEHRPGGERAARVLTVLGVPLSQASISPSQAHLTPAAVRAALRRFSTYCAELDVDLETVDVVDLGDLDLAGLDNEDAQAALARHLREKPPSAELAQLHAGADLARLHPGAELLVLLGGDNALTRPALRALAPDIRRVGLLTLDAHHDVRGFHAGPTNGTPVRGLIEDGLPGRNVAQVGLGAFTNSRAYRRYADEQQITVVTATDARAEGAGRCVARLLDELAGRCDWLYVDLDVDVLDAAFAPGCPGARPGGLAPWELHDAAAQAGLHAAVRVVDIVEVDAAADTHGVTVDNAALCLLHAAAGLAGRSAG